jgi:hypothetical protein
MRAWRIHTVCANTALEIGNLSQCRVLSTCAEEVTQRTAVDTAVATLVEELESFAVVGGGLMTVIHGCSSLVLFKSLMVGLLGCWAWVCDAAVGKVKLQC